MHAGQSVEVTQPKEPLKVKQHSALKVAVVEFTVIFVSEVSWSLIRKTGLSIIDAFGIALLTASVLFVFHHR